MIEITEEQVDNAVADAKHWPRKFGWSSAMWGLLGRLGINQCDGCSGTGESSRMGILDFNDGTYKTVNIEKCPSCCGHGWIYDAE